MRTIHLRLLLRERRKFRLKLLDLRLELRGRRIGRVDIGRQLVDVGLELARLRHGLRSLLVAIRLLGCLGRGLSREAVDQLGGEVLGLQEGDDAEFRPAIQFPVL